MVNEEGWGDLMIMDVHVERAFSLEHLAGVGGLVVERDVGPEGLHERHLVV